MSVSPDLAWLRWLAGAPWAALLGAGVGLLAERSLRPWPSLLLALSCPGLVMALGRGMMPDLMATSLLTAALCGWLLARGPEGGPTEGEGRAPVPHERALLIGAGLALALAGFTRYTALILAPALLWEAHRRGALRRTLPFWLAFALPWLAGELWLGALYGRWHLLEVLSRAGEIPRGPLSERALGALVRLGLVLGPAALLGLRGRVAGLSMLVGGAALAVGWPADLDIAGRTTLLIYATVGALALLGAAGARRAGARELGLLGGLVFLSVVLGHNYAADRYLLSGLAPLALALASQRRGGWILAAAAAQLVLSVVLFRAESTYARGAELVAAEMTEAGEPGTFTGEWSFRWRMEQAGWTFRATPPSSGRVAIPLNASPGFGPQPGWIADGSMVLEPGGGLRILDLERGVGLYAETLGPLPFAWTTGSLEELRIWQVR